MATCAKSPEVIDYLYQVWKSHNESIFQESDYMEMAYRLAIMRPQEWESILELQRQRLRNEQQREEFLFVSRACNPDANIRKALTNSLEKPLENQNKLWVRHALQLLNSR